MTEFKSADEFFKKMKEGLMADTNKIEEAMLEEFTERFTIILQIAFQSAVDNIVGWICDEEVVGKK